MLKCVRELPGFYLVAVAADSFACRGHWSTRISGAALSLFRWRRVIRARAKVVVVVVVVAAAPHGY